MSAKAIRGVALGIVVTAFVQSLCGGIGLNFGRRTRRRAASTALTPTSFLHCADRAGVGAASRGHLGCFIAGTTWPVACLRSGPFLSVSLTNSCGPVLIRKGVDLPMLLILTGVIGGLISFGIIGLFIGPVILAVTFTLLRAWISRGENLATPVAAESPPPAVDQ